MITVAQACMLGPGGLVRVRLDPDVGNLLLPTVSGAVCPLAVWQPGLDMDPPYLVVVCQNGELLGLQLEQLDLPREPLAMTTEGPRDRPAAPIPDATPAAVPSDRLAPGWWWCRDEWGNRHAVELAQSPLNGELYFIHRRREGAIEWNTSIARRSDLTWLGRVATEPLPPADDDPH